MSEFVNTNELRFVTRYVPVQGKDYSEGRRILQQRWVKVGTLHSAPLTADNSEWRDVPLGEDES